MQAGQKFSGRRGKAVSGMIRIIFVLFFFSINLLASQDVRVVKSTSCNAIRVNLGLGMSTQIVLEQEPKVTLYADKTHFKIKTNSMSPRSLAIIPYVSPSEIEGLSQGNGSSLSPKKLASALDDSLKTNLFVFFENNNQLMFELRFVEKTRADYILKVQQEFDKECVL
jgi:hypothetical protein